MTGSFRITFLGLLEKSHPLTLVVCCDSPFEENILYFKFVLSLLVKCKVKPSWSRACKKNTSLVQLLNALD
jgi:hypothetical protein